MAEGKDKKTLQVGNFLTAKAVSGHKVSGKVVKILENTVVVEKDSGVLELIKKQVVKDLGYSLPRFDKKKGTY